MSADTPIVSDALWSLISKGTKIPGIQKTQIFPNPPLFDGTKITVEWSITIEQFQAIEEKNGGRAGIIPFFYNNFEPYYFLNFSAEKKGKNEKFGNLLSDFGGGISKHEKIYKGFKRELDEEIPKWKNELVRTLNEEKDNYCLIHCTETMYVDEKEDEEMTKKGSLRHRILVICEVNPYKLLYDADNNLLYRPGEVVSKEVSLLTEMSHSKLVYSVTNPYTKMNDGLRQFKKIYNL